MLSVVTFKWRQPNYHTRYESEHVNVLRNMVARNYPDQHRFFCVTDDPAGLDPGIIVVPLWQEHSRLKNPSNLTGPSCYRRLKLFSKEASDIFGDRLVALDLDTVIVADVRPLWNRPEPFVGWGDTHPRTRYNGSMFLLKTGSRTFIWDEFDPVRSPREAHGAKHFGSDQGWLSYRLGPNEARWANNAGIYSWRVHLHPKGGSLPNDARVVMFHGKVKPWDTAVLGQHEWVRRCWR